MILAVAGLWIASLPGGDRIEHVFEYRAELSLQTVNLAGTFNGWDKSSSPMRLAADGKTWRLAVPLKPGKHLYKFVLNGEQWITDPKATRNEDDGNGHTNSVLMLLPADYARPAKAGDGVIARSAIQATSVNWDRGKMSVGLRTRPGDLDFVEMFLDSPSGEKCIELHETARDDVYATYHATFDWNRKTDLKYRFMLVDGAVRRYFTPSGLTEQPGPAFTIKAKEFRPFVVPSWVEKSVVYQIFPDRFANGDKANDPADVMPWDGKPTYSNRFGGDVAGVREHLGYLKSLGVGAVYFNPIFKSPSNHRYDASDYEQVDPQFGTNAEFFALTKAMHAEGIKTILDFAFNHTAVDFPAFMDIRRRGESSKYKSWYWIKSYPVEVRENPPYVAWFGFPSMPKLNVMNPETHAYVLGVVDYWKKNAGIDGLRLDVANEVDMQMWRDLRKHLKSTSPNTWIVGEEWGDASAWLGGDQWDASMNYPFRDACLRFFAQGSIGGKEFAKRLMGNYALYVPQVSRNQLNLLSSHDTPRFMTYCNGNKRLAILAATLQLTWVGTPSIYYGEELGMEGKEDPDNRRGMAWPLATAANPILDAYKRLIVLRNASPALQSGEPRLLASDQTSVVFARILPRDQAIVAINRSSVVRKITVTLPAEITAKDFKDALGQATYRAQKGTLSLSITPLSAAVLRPVKSNSRHHSRPSAGARRNP